ncbi:DUF4367 domain-containing protein [Paenibacillus sp. NAIST15-1]|uniref:DUF4367 domain-containing protein n=1 Tax=Paenibacillus sp. NAIST15-1 TaxID=1605994 RepID=UPI00086D7F85|nr:DUF4367 domain-containing protein [Paenibacillus sp. NAIST15-1]GAV13619.1 hypothetical protein PBN151_3556 [Paenibacillus sp. NAIST15-1]
MERIRSIIEDEEIRRYERELDTELMIDIREPVMQRIDSLHVHRKPMNHSRARLRRKTIIVLTSIIVALTSIWGYAASRIIQILNSKGDVVVETRERNLTPRDFRIDKKLEEYGEMVKAQLKPGEWAAYYVKDEQYTHLTQINRVNFEYNPIVHTYYDRLQQEIKDKAGVSAVDIANAPIGLKFESGWVFPSVYPFNEIKGLAEQFEKEAKQAKNNQNLFIKPLAWKEVGSSRANFNYDGNQLKLIGFYHTQSRVVSQNTSGIAVSKLKLNGMEVLYKESVQGKNASFKHQVEWMREDESTYYMLSDEAESKLSKSEFIEIAKSMVGK